MNEAELCPQCGAELQEHNNKLICPKCGLCVTC